MSGTEQVLYANVIVDISHEKLDKIFSVPRAGCSADADSSGNSRCGSIWKRQPQDTGLCGQTDGPDRLSAGKDQRNTGSLCRSDRRRRKADRTGCVDAGLLWFHDDPGIKSSASGQTESGTERTETDSSAAAGKKKHGKCCRFWKRKIRKPGQDF